MNNVILLVALIGQFDMSGAEGTRADFDMSGVSGVEVAKSSFDMGSLPRSFPLKLEVPPPPPPAAKPIVFAYYAPFQCDPCEAAKVALAGARDLAVEVQEKSPPSWVAAFPTFHFAQSDGQWRQIKGWPGLKALQDVVLRTYRAASVVVDAAASPTPHTEVDRVLGLLPRPTVRFVDWGCGDGRWVIAAAEKWGCPCTGVEIDPARAAAARERVKAAGLERLVTIITGDATKVDVDADVGVAYLYSDVLQALLPKIQRLKAFASYKHRPPGLPVIQNGDAWIYNAPVVTHQRGAVWGGQVYSSPVCTDPSCGMCASIRSQLGHQQQSSRRAMSAQPRTRSFLGFYWE